jgi:hypothetical protein
MWRTLPVEQLELLQRPDRGRGTAPRSAPAKPTSAMSSRIFRASNMRGGEFATLLVPLELVFLLDAMRFIRDGCPAAGFSRSTSIARFPSSLVAASLIEALSLHQRARRRPDAHAGCASSR